MIKFFLFISCSLPLLVFANIIDVGQGYPHPTIQAALIEARNGDQIRIHPGKYNEYDLVIGVPLTITGIGWPVIDGMSKGEIMSIKSDSVLVSGIVLRNKGRSSTKDFAAVRVYSASHVNISGNRVEDAFFGIYLENSSRCVIHDNQVQSSVMTEQMLGNGIHCWKCDSLEIDCNTLSNHRDGIYFEFVTNSSIRSNYSFSNMRYGLHFMFSHNDVYEGNVFESNGAGVAVMYTKEVKMISNQFVENWGASSYGLL
ncbi:MAG: right-handed parallel beta-helix repeat-containing protein, partial [Flavobacteriales bacterium]|nr:right-handed parallel beta-helix repeat-containing protein [Flavobacteriales bacterium]